MNVEVFENRRSVVATALWAVSSAAGEPANGPQGRGYNR
jgi:hypothetical protein